MIAPGDAVGDGLPDGCRRCSLEAGGCVTRANVRQHQGRFAGSDQRVPGQDQQGDHEETDRRQIAT
jgi:hypothetical protein